MQLSDNISCFSRPQKPNIFGVPNTNSKYSRKKVSHTKPVMPTVETETVNLAYQMPYPGPEAYHFPSGPSHNSPCMDQYWRAQPIRQSEPREEETEHEDCYEEDDVFTDD